MSGEEMAISVREHPDVDPAILELAISMARERGGCTMPVSDYDIRHARDRIAGEQSKIARLMAENSALRIGWWNDMRKRGVTQDMAIEAIREATHPTPDSRTTDGEASYE